MARRITMGDVFWLGAVAVAVVAGVAVAALVHLAGRRAKRGMFRRLRRDDEFRGRELAWLNRPQSAPQIPVQLVREPPPLDEPKVLGRIGPAGRS
jgi:hypothetical protein